MKLTRKKAATILFTTMLLQGHASAAGGIADSKLGVGLVNLVTDVATFMAVLCPVAGAAAAAYFFTRRSMADEQDGKMWEKRIKTAIICGVLGCLTSLMISVVASYFQ